MPVSKYDDVYEKVEYSGKIFIYNSPTWNTLFPIVDIIRILKKNTIIGFKYGKGQQSIRMYGTQYNHCMSGYELKNKDDYLKLNFKNIFTFSDEPDYIITNLINFSKKNKVNVICYSNIDGVYHFYEGENKFQFKKAQDVVDKMYALLDFDGVKRLSELFPEFEILEPPPENTETTLDKSIALFKQQEKKVQQEKKYTKVYDPHLSKLKKMEYERNQKSIVYTDTPPNENMKHRPLLAKFFSKLTF